MKIKITRVFDYESTKKKVVAEILSKELPKEGVIYLLKEEHTDKQRKLFEPLCRLYYNSMCYPKRLPSWEDLRDAIKTRLGQGYDRLKYVDENFKIVTIKYKDRREKVPECVLLDYHAGNKDRIEGVLKSTTRYSKSQFHFMTDSMIREMIQNGVLLSSQKNRFNQILNTIGFVE